MAVAALVDLRGLRTAPSLSEAERQVLRQELQELLAACDWFTVGVMAPSASAATTALRHCEAALGWSPLTPLNGRDPEGGASAAAAEAGPVFLKGNQNTGSFSLRHENGLGEGLLISGHSPADPDAEDTWGPLPLDFFG
ncbi:DUF1824 family protein [Synechococcus sp. CS-1328]|uniref:DUF1824 family protein n=1 Tax=Synechococcus sp. CS-1328 TaxID=2847976 RepID=UPI00223ADEC3|nr:DUF1824 family protein [Synechococcus sp. CS-1328]MCT0225120.1 DUF1824 family protein [Synechococcus sp. CS-1328]